MRFADTTDLMLPLALSTKSPAKTRGPGSNSRLIHTLQQNSNKTGMYCRQDTCKTLRAARSSPSGSSCRRLFRRDLVARQLAAWSLLCAILFMRERL
ncbi:hypothetical protein LX36DRAFT_189552 [Colletotrichum falcatum]|nr:hypothetical protein LX36DRAFT_189552 [Colletotrichum falcatum]